MKYTTSHIRNQSKFLKSQQIRFENKLSYKEQREFEPLPGRIGELEVEQENLNKAAAHPEFYKEPAEVIKQVLMRPRSAARPARFSCQCWRGLTQRAVIVRRSF